MFDLLIGAAQLVLVIIGFGMVILIHELGHFLAARWAGIRVHEFAIGFGPAICSWRKGLGFRTASTTAEYERMLVARGGKNAGPETLPDLSPTEYRLNYLPIGGYVKMLGQEDLNPDATSQAEDSYNRKPVWKRLVVISAGVVMNVILAAVLFVAVFMVGLPAPPAIVGGVAPGSPAATAIPVNAEQAGVQQTGLQPGDRVVEIDRGEVLSFKDVVAAAGLAKRGRPLNLVVDRPGVGALLQFSIEPEEGAQSRLLELGVGVALSGRIAAGPDERDPVRARWNDALEAAGLAALEPGSRLISVAGEPARLMHELTRALEESDGEAVSATFVTPAGEERTVLIQPARRMQTLFVPLAAQEDVVQVPVTHLLGLTPVMQVAEPQPRGAGFGLMAGDVLTRIGSVRFPNSARGIREIKRSAGDSISLAALRDESERTIEATVTNQGTIGFIPTEALDRTLLAATPRQALQNGAELPAEIETPAERLGLPPGSVIDSIAGEPVSDFAEMRAALRKATAQAHESGIGATVSIAARLPIGWPSPERPTQEIAWTLTPEDVQTLHALGWTSPIDPGLFEISTTTLQADNPVEALSMGLSETKRVIVMTYVTLLRLFEGSVQVEHLRGPVGIAHLGTQVVDQGLIQLLFFLAVISANLAVINFLPLPIVDGGHAVFLISEWITGRPVSVAVQNLATLAGLLLIGAVFLVVTFNDISNIVAP